MSFAERLKELRSEYELSQKGLANQTGYTQATISLWEKAEREPTATALITLAQFFNCSIDFLIGISDEWGGALTNANDNLSPDKHYILDLYEQMDEEHRENITATMELFVRNSKKSRLKKDG